GARNEAAFVDGGCRGDVRNAGGRFWRRYGRRFQRGFNGGWVDLPLHCPILARGIGRGGIKSESLPQGTRRRSIGSSGMKRVFPAGRHFDGLAAIRPSDRMQGRLSFPIWRTLLGTLTITSGYA